MRALQPRNRNPRHCQSPNLSLFKQLKLKHFPPATTPPRSILESGIMSSDRKIQSSRANGARSRGPVTESGKQISSQNARSHALLARCVVVEGESHEGFEKTLTEYLERFQPADAVEFDIVEEMVAAGWRMRRAWAIETRLLTDCVDAQDPCDGTGRLAAAFNTMADSKALALMHRYETRMHRVYQRALKNLLLLQTSKVPNEPNPISEHLDTTPDLQPPAPGPQPAAPDAPQPAPAADHDHAVPNEPNPISEHLDPTPDLRPPTPGPRPQAPDAPPAPSPRPPTRSLF